MFFTNKLCTKAVIENIKSQNFSKVFLWNRVSYGLVAYWLILK